MVWRVYSYPMTQATALSILKSGANVFLTGEPGSGKTYLVNAYVRYLRQHDIRVAITASTGIAATHISGVTIHSWSGIGIRKALNDVDLEILLNTERLVKQITGTQVLIIDEISMLDAGTLEMVDQVCRTLRNSNEPFGGLQTMLVGDFFQLPPVSKYGEAAAQFAFTSPAWSNSLFEVCYLTEQHRQSDEALSSVLSAIRRGEILEEIVAHLTTRKIAHHNENDGATKLYAHNMNVDEVNASKLTEIKEDVHVFEMTNHGPKNKVEALIRGCLSPERLELKVGAAVMCTRNSPDKGFVNGTLATVTDFDDAEGDPIITTRNGRRIVVEPMDWAMDEGEKGSASITQIPLRLAWAMTVHKSQGMSLDAAVMDLSHSFAFGQGYVALSRVRTLDGLFLLGWNERALKVDPLIQEQDGVMRANSDRIEKLWLAKSEHDHEQAVQEFLNRTGGIKREERAPIVPGQVVDVPPHAKRLSEIRKQYPQAYTPWTETMDQELTTLHKAERSIGEISKKLERHPGGIRTRLRKLGLMN